MQTYRADRTGCRHDRGETLIEVLIALVVIAVGLLGMAGLQTRAKMVEMEAYQRVQAQVLLDDMADRLAANRPFRNCYDLSKSSPPYLGTGATRVGACDARAEADLTAWDALLDGAAETLAGTNTGAMVGARGCVRAIAADLFEVSVAWQGFSRTVAPANPCAATPADLYGDPALRRVMSRTIRFAQLQ